MRTQSLAMITEHPIVNTQARVSAIDIVRGLIMALMALAHCQEYICTSQNHPLDWDEPSRWLFNSYFEFFQHAFISMTASGGFFMMMGIGIVLLWHAREKEGWAHERICQYLIKRGALLIFVQFALLWPFEIVAQASIFFYVGVLFALGSCMIGASLLLYVFKKINSNAKILLFPVQYILLPLIIIGIFIIGDLIIDYVHDVGLDPSAWLISLFLGGSFSLADFKVDVDFTPIPWFPAVAFGLLLGEIIVTHREKAWPRIKYVAILLLFLWLMIRIFQPWIGFGDYKNLADPNSLDIASLFLMSKYPPSPSYFLYSFGVILLFITGIRSWQISMPRTSKLIEPLQVFGRSPLFFFIAHWFIYYGLSLMLPHTVEAVTGIMLFWLLGLSVLYVLCKNYYPWKMSKEKESLWRMF